MCHFCLWSDRAHNPSWATSTSHSTSISSVSGTLPSRHLITCQKMTKVTITRIQVRRMPNFVPIACQISRHSAEKWKSYSDLKLSWHIPCPGLWAPCLPSPGVRLGRLGDAGSLPARRGPLPSPGCLLHPGNRSCREFFFIFDPI